MSEFKENIMDVTYSKHMTNMKELMNSSLFTRLLGLLTSY